MVRREKVEIELGKTRQNCDFNTCFVFFTGTLSLAEACSKFQVIIIIIIIINFIKAREVLQPVLIPTLFISWERGGAKEEGKWRGVEGESYQSRSGQDIPSTAKTFNPSAI